MFLITVGKADTFLSRAHYDSIENKQLLGLLPLVSFLVNLSF